MLSITEAVELIRSGDVVAFPSETVYGIGCDPLNVAAAERIFILKNRPADMPLSLHVSDPEQAEPFTADMPAEALKLIEHFWPGPLALIVRRSELLPARVTGGRDTVSLRCPDHPVCLEFLQQLGSPVAGTSANRSAGLSPTRVEDVMAEMPGVPVLDGGPCSRGIESTIVDLTTQPFRILRQGVLEHARIAELLPGLAREETAPLRPPVLRSRVTLFRPGGEITPADSFVLLSLGSQVPGARHVINMPDDPGEYARQLYAALRQAEALGCDEIVIELPVTDEPAWSAVLARLKKLKN